MMVLIQCEKYLLMVEFNFFYLNSSTNLIFFDIVWKNGISNRETETTTSITLKTLNLDMMVLIQWKILMVEFKN